LPEAIARMSENPAQVLGVPSARIEKNQVADIAIFDLDKEWTVVADKFESKGKNSVFNGMKLAGAAQYVFSRGKLRLDGGAISLN